MIDPMNASTLNFKQAFEVLRQNSQKLEQQDEPDIDQLMSIVEESMQAYKVCKSRIQAVQQALDATFASED